MSWTWVIFICICKNYYKRPYEVVNKNYRSLKVYILHRIYSYCKYMICFNYMSGNWRRSVLLIFANYIKLFPKILLKMQTIFHLYSPLSFVNICQCLQLVTHFKTQVTKTQLFKKYRNIVVRYLQVIY